MAIRCIMTTLVPVLFPAVLLWTVCPSTMGAAEQDSTFSVADGKISMKVPADWVRQKPLVRMIEAEFSVPAEQGDPADGRCTVMGAGGSVQANIDRWVAQFDDPERKTTEKKEISGQRVYLVDLAGTYKDQRGPFAPAVLRENYRVLGAIIETRNDGLYFIKFYGPQATISAHEKAFHEMLNSLQVK
jgi:hypothetical protein